ncbi:MAG: metallophosphoesterase, partial [Candidatus Hydrogenedentes bacterium]|nr:metallophosphoesterase [Candidatus Hydrogenedentota bacterium]
MKQTTWRWLVPVLLGVLLCPASPAWAGTPQPNPGKLPCWPGQAPPADTTEKFTFAILGDKTSGGEGKWPIFDRAVDAINLLAPDFVITTGDHIPGHMEEKAQWTEEWREYREHAARLRPPLWLIPGNHDISNTACHRFWQEDLGDTYYAFTHKGCLFLVLNTEEERFDGRGQIWRAMMDFARETLSNSQEARHSFIFFHKPMWDDPRFSADWAELEGMLGDRPCTVIAGHEHYLSTERRGNKLLVIQNATGGGIHLSNVREYGCFHAFALVTIEGNSAHYAIIEPDGGVWPPEIAPAAFRKQFTFGMVSPTAELPEHLPDGSWRVKGRAELSNPFDTPVTLQLRIGPLSKSGWQPAKDTASFPPACGQGSTTGNPSPQSSFPPACGGAGGEFLPQAGNTVPPFIENDELVLERHLEPGMTETVPLPFTVPEAR